MASLAKPVARGATTRRSRGEAAGRGRKGKRRRSDPQRAPADGLLMQPKLKVGEPDDEYEREADRIADQVVNGPSRRVRKASGRSSANGGAAEQAARRAPLSGKEQDEPSANSLPHPEIEKDELAQKAPMTEHQPDDDELAQKAPMTEHQPDDDELAQKAPMTEPQPDDDELAQKAPMTEPQPDDDELAQKAPMTEPQPDDDEVAQKAQAAQPEPESEPAPEPEPEPDEVAAEPDEEEEVAQKADKTEEAARPAAGGEELEEVQRRATRRRRPRVSGSFELALKRLRQAGGQRLPSPLRQFMETRFGLDLGQVRVHAGETAQSLAKTLRARAFTVGRDIVFGAGEYHPTSAQGRRLLAHELTHVLQQRGGLHSVQREVQTEPEKPRAPSSSTLLDLFDLRRGVPRAVLGIVLEMIERALGQGEPAQTLAALTDEQVDATTTTRTILSSTHRLVLESQWTGSGQRIAWILKDAVTDEPIFARTHERAGDATDSAASQARDDATISIATPLGTRAEQEAKERYDQPEPAQPEAGNVEEPRSPQVQSGRGRADTRSKPAPTPPESDKLAAVDAAKPAAGEKNASPEGGGEQSGADNPALARKPIDEEQEDEVPEEQPAAENAPANRDPVQRKVEPGQNALRDRRAHGDVTGVIAAPGRALPNELRRFMEARLGGTFDRVRIHDDARAGRAARALGARAFTRGEHVVFAPGRFAPHTSDGRRLLAHELTHVMQQRDGALSLIQRDTECPPPDPVPETEVIASPASPEADPAFNAAAQRTGNRAHNQAEHGEGSDKSAAANSAAEVKEGEKKSHAQKDQVGKMDAEAQNPPAFDKEAFTERVLSEVEKIAPATLNDVFKFRERNKAGEVKGAVSGEVDSAQEKSQGPLGEASKAEPGAGESPRTATDLEIEQPGARPGSIRADRAMPPPKTASEFDLTPDAVRTENILKEACVTREFMDKHGDPELKTAAAAQDELATATAESPQEYREEEAEALANARSDASAKGQAGVAGMFGERSGNFADIGGAQTQTKSDNELKRDAAAKEIDGIFTSTQSKVTTRLSELDEEVTDTFGKDADAAVSKFERFIDTNAKKYEKGWFDKTVDWIAEKLFDAPPQEVWDFYGEGRRAFVADLRTAIGKVADLVDKGLKDAKKLVEDGKKEVQTKLDSLGSDLEDFKQQKSEEMADKFRSLEAEIKKKEAEIVSSLAKRYVQALEAAKAAEDRVREKYKTFIDRAKEAYNAVKDAVVGWIEKLAAIVGDVAKKIIHDPGAFLSNLGAGIVQGLNMFLDGIEENLKGAVIQWLTGNMAGAGITLPASFDAKGIIGFLLDLVGLGVASIKNIARKVFGNEIVSAIEKGVEGAEQAKRIFDVLASEGPAGLFQFLADEFSKMKEQVLGEIGKAIAETLVIAGIKKVIGIISGLVSGGVGTVVTIVATIIDVVLWFRSNAAQLAEVVSTVAGLANAIVQGQVGALANAVNALLKRLLPVVLGFVGALIGIGGVVGKIQKIFQSIQKPATKAITGLFQKIKNALKGLLQKVKKALKKRKKKAKGKKKGAGKKKGLLTPREVVDQVAAKLAKPTGAADPAAALTEKRASAEALRGQFQPKLEKGKLKIVITDTGPEAVEKDSAVDFSVSVNPGKDGEAPLKDVPVPEKIDLITLDFKLPARLQDGSVTQREKDAGYTEAEFKRQLRGQEAGINAMSVGTWAKNRSSYDKRKKDTGKSGRDPASAKHQREARANFRAAIINTLTATLDASSPLNLSGAQADGLPWGYAATFIKETRAKKGGALSPTEAQKAVDAWMKQQAALHDPDQVAGGDASAIYDLGHASINSSLGSQWGNGLADKLKAGVVAFVREKRVRRINWPKVKMAVSLNPK